MFRALAAVSDWAGGIVALVFIIAALVRFPSSPTDALFLFLGALVALAGGRVLKKIYAAMDDAPRE